MDDQSCKQPNLRRPLPQGGEGETVTSQSQWQSVTITRVENGFSIKIGCKLFVALTWAEASRGLGEYWVDPAQAEKKYTF